MFFNEQIVMIHVKYVENECSCIKLQQKSRILQQDSAKTFPQNETCNIYFYCLMHVHTCLKVFYDIKIILQFIKLTILSTLNNFSIM